MCIFVSSSLHQQADKFLPAQIHHQRQAWAKFNIRFFKEEENYPLVLVKPLAKVKTVQNCSHQEAFGLRRPAAPPVGNKI
jgi:hypothetical protein